ncbi:disease resistance protein RPM1-like isoform X2 [Humulus lupulus]|uniref:disease resistance protein RPM1-like n=1 Tax=Humulus lupulus TaxID=3486 RepID=UPI002B4099A8|nr:disease resistance protein RPM1-like [Humulus lupulus]XP_062076634.1 disease resistance protein RPM1-like isoform X2 [Humulus lupulus]
MAEIAVGLVIDKLIPLLTEEAYLLRGIHKDVERIKCDLDFLLAFLKDADAKAYTNPNNNISHGVKVWVEKLRKAAFEVEDVIDEYTHLFKQQQSHSYSQRFIAFFRTSACLVIKLTPHHNMASKIKDIRQTIREINQTSASYGFNSTMQEESSSRSQSSRWYDPRKNSCFIKERELVGIESSRDELIKKVVGGSPKRTVISLVGMGGLGKTTLAYQVYVRTQRSFDCHAWIEVSQSYEKVELLQKLAKKLYDSREESIPNGFDAMDEFTLTTKLRDYLQEKNYLVIFDDVWEQTFWGNIQNIFPDDGQKNRRVVFTTRNVEVARFCNESSYAHIHQLQPLLPEKSWELFCRKTFRNELNDGCCPPHLEKLSHEIVERCEGLPLAIVLIAGLLSTTNNTIEEWRKMLTTISSELQSNQHLESITKILLLSYNDLPYYLKPCFLYLGYFPEDYPMRCGRLIRQWIAEGFVKSSKGKALEDIAEDYLKDLVNRNLVQVLEVDFDGKARTCRIHDLLREIVINKMEDLSFCQVLSAKGCSFKGSSRRISIVNGSYEVIKSNTSTDFEVRSIFIFDKGEVLNHRVREIIINFKLLKVLDFENAPNLNHLPKDVGILFHLKYLSVRHTRVSSLPKSIEKLENLETLDLKHTLVLEIPIEIKRFRNLRHLLAYRIDGNERFDYLKGIKVDMGIGQLKALQKLSFINVNVDGFDLFEELCKLTELRKLGINKLRSEDGKRLCDCIQNMNLLESLDISSISEDETIDLESMSCPPQFLRHLHLLGPLKNFDKWIVKLQNLSRIGIYRSKLQIDPLNVLGDLPNLLELRICNDGYDGDKLQFEKESFPKLKLLLLESLVNLRLIVIEEGALCNLEDLHIGGCPQLKQLPSGFQCLRNLKKLQWFELPKILLMSQTFQTFHRAGVDIRLYYPVDGKFWMCRMEQIVAVIEFVRDQISEDEWESKLDELFIWLISQTL